MSEDEQQQQQQPAQAPPMRATPPAAPRWHKGLVSKTSYMKLRTPDMADIQDAGGDFEGTGWAWYWIQIMIFEAGGKEGAAQLYIEQIATRFGCGKRTACTRLAILERIGLIRRFPVMAPARNGTAKPQRDATIYQLVDVATREQVAQKVARRSCKKLRDPRANDGQPSIAQSGEAKLSGSGTAAEGRTDPAFGKKEGKNPRGRAQRPAGGAPEGAPAAAPAAAGGEAEPDRRAATSPEAADAGADWRAAYRAGRRRED